MTLRLSPEVEAIIQKHLEQGAFSSAEEVVERALEFLSAEEDWLAENRDRTGAQIQEGWDQAQRGELTGIDEVRAEMQQFKKEWIRQHQPA